MKKDKKPVLPTLLFICIVAAIFIANSMVSGKLDNIIPTHKRRAVFYENGRQMNITNESFSLPFFEVSDQNNILKPVTQREYDTISQCDFFRPLMEMIDREITVQARGHEELPDGIYRSMFFMTDESGHKKYYAIGSFMNDNTYKELMAAFTPEKGVELFICFDNIVYGRGVMIHPSTSSVLKDESSFNNSLKQTIIDEAVRYMNYIIRQGLTDISSELYFSTKSIMVEGNLCFIQDSASQVTVFYDWVNEKVVGFQKNK